MKKVIYVTIFMMIILTIALILYYSKSNDDYDWNKSLPMVSQEEINHVQECYSLIDIPNENRSEFFRYCQINEKNLNKLKILSSVDGLIVCSMDETNYADNNCDFYKSCNELTRIDYTDGSVRPSNKGRVIYECDNQYYLLEGVGVSMAPYYKISIIKLTDEQINILKD